MAMVIFSRLSDALFLTVYNHSSFSSEPQHLEHFIKLKTLMHHQICRNACPCTFVLNVQSQMR